MGMGRGPEDDEDDVEDLGADAFEANDDGDDDDDYQAVSEETDDEEAEAEEVRLPFLLLLNLHLSAVRASWFFLCARIPAVERGCEIRFTLPPAWDDLGSRAFGFEVTRARTNRVARAMFSLLGRRKKAFSRQPFLVYLSTPAREESQLLSREKIKTTPTYSMIPDLTTLTLLAFEIWLSSAPGCAVAEQD